VGRHFKVSECTDGACIVDGHFAYQPMPIFRYNNTSEIPGEREREKSVVGFRSGNDCRLEKRMKNRYNASETGVLVCFGRRGPYDVPEEEGIVA
jgi:hypothetical protein